MGRTLLAALLSTLVLTLLAGTATAVPIDSPTDQWVSVGYSAPPDWADDQATGANEADIVGDLDHSALYTFFDDAGTASLTDGTLSFRLRLGSDDNPTGFKHVGVVGIDIDLDNAVDVLIVVDNKGGSPDIAIRSVTGDGTSPAQTAINTSSGVTYTPVQGSNYDWQAVTVLSDPGPNQNADIDNDGDTDYFLSFSVSFQDLVTHLGGAIDQNTTVAYVAGTSTNSNSVNQDWVGPNGGVGSASNWTTLGGFSNPTTVSTVTPIPEPGTALLLGWGLVAIGIARRRCA